MNDVKKNEVARLGRLVRRFASAKGPPFPGSEVDEFDLWWQLGPLLFGIAEVLSKDHALFQKGRTASDESSWPLARAVWLEVERLPYATVERMIDAVQKRRGLWELEDHLQDGVDEFQA